MEVTDQTLQTVGRIRQIAQLSLPRVTRRTANVVSVRQKHMRQIHIEQHTPFHFRKRRQALDHLMEALHITDQVSTAGLHLQTQAGTVRRLQKRMTTFIAIHIAQALTQA